MTSTARTGQTLLIAASTLFFAAFTSAMVVRRGLGADWETPALPPWIWATALLAVAASWMVERDRIRGAMASGALLVAAQVAVLLNFRMGLIGEAFGAVLIGAHAVHAAGGVVALSSFGARASLFWHFAAALWLYVLFLFGVWA